MVSGNITDEHDDRTTITSGVKPVCGMTLEVVVANGTSEKAEIVDSLIHRCLNCLLTDVYFIAPAIGTSGKTVRLELLGEDEEEIFSTGDLDATNAEKHSRHTQRGLRGKAKVKIVCDDNVSGEKAFFVKFRGL